MEKIAALGSIGAIGRSALKWDPLITSTLLGSILGAVGSGENRRIRGVMLGGLGGMGAGLMGAGLRKGTAKMGIPRFDKKHLLGQDPALLQHLFGGLGGLTTGAIIQPEPVPINVGGGILGKQDSGNVIDDVDSTINQAKNLLRESSGVERV